MSSLHSLLLSIARSQVEAEPNHHRRAELTPFPFFLTTRSSSNSNFVSGWTSNHTRIRELCDQYGAWLHIDAGQSPLFPSRFVRRARADILLSLHLLSTSHNICSPPHRRSTPPTAFGAFATLLPSFAHLASDLALGDSITSDAHKCTSLFLCLLHHSLSLSLAVADPHLRFAGLYVSLSLCSGAHLVL